LWDAMDYGIFTAAVADFKPQAGLAHEEDTNSFHTVKFKKESHADGFDIHFTPNHDILKSIGQIKKTGQKLMGFSAESGAQTDELAKTVKQKLANKNCDIVVGNFISEAMGKKTNKVYVADKNGIEEAWGTMSKADLAWDLLSYLESV
ncbi:MAG: bifunctional phosphopantothenoylcysteine decarboxylase/phosphopantothenate--cysteine ligase CoaBC, partial [Mailhella sp.]|nr:bifunctional phosphopantothenoylcysteine decarboxylase/phosphopantothenate--cysteine ligase CoaBC [Mailhella sp.]